MTAIAMNYMDLPNWERSFTEFPVRPRVEIVSKPWGSSLISSGGYYSSPFEVSPESGVTRWFDDILSLSDEAICPLTTPEVPAALAEIRDAFSLKISQLSEILHVTRQTIYNWMDGKPVDETNRRRVAAVRDLALCWLREYKKPMGPVVAEEIDGESLLSLLRADVPDDRAILRKFEAIAGRLAAAEANRPPSARELAAKFGLEPLSEEAYRRNLQSVLLRGR